MCAFRTDPLAVTANPHLTTEALTAGNPNAAIAAVLFHGRDQDPEWMLDVARRIDLDDAVSYILPRAADRSWYPGRFYDPMEDNEPWLGWSLQAIDAVRDTVAAFQRAGARCELRVYDDEEHGVNDDEVAAVRGLLLSLLEAL